MKEKIQNINTFLTKNKKMDIEDTILVVGSPRSGTTLLMDIISTLPGYTYIFEPLNPIWFPESFELGFRSRTYLQKDKKWKAGEEYLRKIFTAQITNLPIKDNPISDLLQGFSIKKMMSHLSGDKIIVKSTNMNRMLPWIVENFQLRSIFFIVRHPCATIASQLKSGLYGYRTTLKPYADVSPTKQNVIDEISEMNVFDSNLINKLKKIETKEEILAAVWCLDNYILTSQGKPYPWNLVFYEKLVKNGEEEIKQIFESINEKNIPRSSFSLLKKPTIVTLKEDRKTVKMPDQQLSKWKDYLTEKQIERIMKIVSYFDIDLYS